MATVSTAYATATTFTITLNSLANGSSATSTAVDNTSTQYLDAMILTRIVTASSGVSATGTISLYVQASTDNADFEDVKNDRLIAVVVADAINLTAIRVASVAAAYGGILPPYWRLRVLNNSGAAFASSGHSAVFRGIGAVSA